ncbi:helix-turn-helix domain-containing protein [Martelella soudanensis]|uniref:hypothetical protein n=1 Tax=unclassified Martelella TaxID=2629616 RepID=UPI0015DEE362|nr:MULTISPECIES: hypothetical protein [unclassified Martelella]
MSNLVQVEVRRRNLGSPTRKAVALRMADAASDDGRGVWVSVERIARETEFSERSVQRCIQQFLDEGLLVLVRAATGKVGIANHYDMALEKLENYPEVSPKGIGKRPPSAPFRGDTVSPVEPGRGDTVSGRGDTVSSEGCHPVTRTTLEPPIKPPLEREARERADFPDYEKPETASAESGETPKALERRFADVLKHWKNAKGLPKKQWWAAWIALSPEDRALAEERCVAWHRMLKRNGRDFPPMPSTYFAEKLWTDVGAAEAETRQETAARTERAAPWGPAWGAKRMALLLAGPAEMPARIELRGLFEARFALFNKRDRAHAMRYATERGVSVAAGGGFAYPDDFEDAELARRTLAGFPEVNALHRAARDRRYEQVEPIYDGLAAMMEAVPVDSAMWRRWEDWHDQHNLPFVPETGNQRVVYFPKGGPDGLAAFKQAADAAITTEAAQ